MILTYIIDIDETFNLTQGQGHKVKDQGHIGIYVKNVLVITHERVDGSWKKLMWWSVELRGLLFYSLCLYVCMYVCPYVYVFVSIKLFLLINDERMDG